MLTAPGAAVVAADVATAPGSALVTVASGVRIVTMLVVAVAVAPPLSTLAVGATVAVLDPLSQALSATVSKTPTPSKIKLLIIRFSRKTNS